MRTRNADSPKSAPTKKTPTPKSTPRASRAAKGKQSTSKTPSSEDLSPQILDEVVTPGEENKVVLGKKTPEKKSQKGKATAKAAVKMETAANKVGDVQIEEKKEEPVEMEKKDEIEKEEDKNEESRKEEEEKTEEPREGEEEKIEEPQKEEEENIEEPEMEKETEKIEEPHEGEDCSKQEEETGEKGEGFENIEEADPEDEIPEKNEKDEPTDQQMEENVPEEEQIVEAVSAELAVVNDVAADGGEMVAVGDGDPELDEEVTAGVEEVEEQMEISDMANARKIKKEKEIFVGGLDRDASEEDVKKVFESAGEVEEVRILKDMVTNKNKGFAFVKFATKEMAAKALAEMKNPMVRGKRCGIAPSEDNDTLFLGNICNTWTKEAIRRKLKDYGIDNTVSITLVADTQNEGLSRGFAFLEFPCHADAMVAYKRLQKPDAVFGHPERTAKVAFAEPLREPDPEVMAQVKSVFVDGLPPYWDEDQVKEQFKQYGEIERVVLARNMPTAKRKDFGFVNFTTHEAALAFIEGINNTDLGDGKSKIKSTARLANPLPKTQAVKAGMSGGFRIGHSGIGNYSRFGRGFGRGRFPSHRAGFQGGRGFFSRARGRGRFNLATNNDFGSSYSEFRGGWRPFGARGGRRIMTFGRRGGFERGRGRLFPSGRQTFTPVEDYPRHFAPGEHFVEDPYFYGDVSRGMKRPYSTMEPDPAFMEPGNRSRPRYDHSAPWYDHPDPMASMSGRTHYQGSPGMTVPRSQDYYGFDYGGSAFSSFYGGEPSRRGYYY